MPTAVMISALSLTGADGLTSDDSAPRNVETISKSKAQRPASENATGVSIAVTAQNNSLIKDWTLALTFQNAALTKLWPGSDAGIQVSSIPSTLQNRAGQCGPPTGQSAGPLQDLPVAIRLQR